MLALNLEHNNKNAIRNKRTLSKRPSEVFTECPACSSKNLYQIDEHLVCLSEGCDWNSVFSFLEAREIYRARTK